MAEEIMFTEMTKETILIYEENKFNSIKLII